MKENHILRDAAFWDSIPKELIFGDKMHVNMNAPAFLKAEEIELGSDLYTQVAKYCHEQIIRDNGMKDLVHCPEGGLELIQKAAAKISFDFADAFMRERYERLSVGEAIKAASINNHYHRG